MKYIRYLDEDWDKQEALVAQHSEFVLIANCRGKLASSLFSGLPPVETGILTSSEVVANLDSAVPYSVFSCQIPCTLSYSSYTPHATLETSGLIHPKRLQAGHY